MGLLSNSVYSSGNYEEKNQRQVLLLFFILN